MARPIRNTNPDWIHHISCKVFQDRLLLTPSTLIENTIGGILARYHEYFGVEIFAYSFLGNHYHLIVRAPRRNLWQFMQALNREIAKRVNHLRGRFGTFWLRRYDDQIIVTKADLIACLRYVVCNPVLHGLIDHPKNWPGLNCYWQLINGTERAFTFTNFTAYRKAANTPTRNGRLLRIEEFQTTHVLRLTPPPDYAEDGKKWSHSDLIREIEDGIVSACATAHAERKQFLGRKAVLRQDPESRPVAVKRSQRPVCYTKTISGLRTFLTWFEPWLHAYRRASTLFRAGNLLTVFPPDSLPPPLLYS